MTLFLRNFSTQNSKWSILDKPYVPKLKTEFIASKRRIALKYAK